MAHKRFTFHTRFALLFVCLLIISWSSFTAWPTAVEAALGDTIVYVDLTATGANNGTSWQNAYTDLQTALAAAQPNHSIWIAQGIYRPTSDLSDLAVARTISFEIPNGVELYGGFVGNEAALEERDWELNKTILSGDLEGNDITNAGVITTTTAIVGANTRNILKISDADQSTVLDGLIITGGQTQDSDGDPYQNGAGIHIQRASPSLRNLSFSANHASWGGALIMMESSNPDISSSSFTGNRARNSGGAIGTYGNSQPNLSYLSFSYNHAQNGGAMENGDSAPSLSFITFTENTAIDYGGAIYNNNSSPSISNASFSANRANWQGGAIYNNNSNPTISNASFSANRANWQGGAIYNNNSNPTISNSSFSANSAVNNGGAIYNVDNSSPTMSNASFSANSATYGGAIYNVDNSSPSISNASFSANSATDLGGAIYNYNNSSPIINNASFSANSATRGGAIYNVDNSSPTINNASFSANSATYGGAILNGNNGNTVLSNSIIWGNSSSIALTSGSSMTNIHSLVEGCDPAGGWTVWCGNDGGGNLSPVDPLFVNPISHTSAPTTTGDLRLRAGSPAINVGNNALNSTTTDLDGKPRIIGPAIDLGAYEALLQLFSFVVGNGTIEHTPSTDWHLPDTTVTLTATAQPGWSFAGWSGDLSGSSSPTTLLINDTKQITATFTNDPPTANAGADQTVVADTQVTLDGSASFDADPAQTLSYAWTQTGGPAVVLAGANSAQSTFTAPSVASVLTFSLVVTDSLGVASSTDSVTITVTNGEPVANAGADQSVLAGTLVTLDGSGSSDPDGHLPLAYAWTQTGGPSVPLTAANTAKPSFTAPNSDVILTFELIVTDSVGLASAADSVTIMVQEPPQTLYKVYLPMVRGQEQRPNLVISELSADQNGIRVVIENRGDAATQAGFWVDLYVNPRQTPTANTVWQKIAPSGAAWAVKETIEPGQSLTLTQTSPFYVPDYSFGSFEAGDQLYAYVDSYHSSNSYGVELESDESDNRYGPVAASAAGSIAAFPSTQTGLYQGLPIR